MTSNMLTKYNEFVRQMWLSNCDEREAYGDQRLSLQEYIVDNNTFIEDQFWMEEYGGKSWSMNKGGYF